MEEQGFSRRNFLKATTGALSTLALPQTARPASGGLLTARAGEKPMRLASGVHLFLDDFLIAAQDNLRRAINAPARLPQPVVTGKEDGNFQPYVTVLRDPQTKRFRMWYGVPVDSGQSHLAHIESEDGIHWKRPHRVLDDPAKITFGASVLDDGPNFPVPAHRYKFGWWTNGFCVAFSPDGLKWTAAGSGRVLEGVNDIVSLARDPIRNRYLLTCKVDSRQEDGYKGRTPNAPEGYRRCVGQSVSKDCVTWEPARRIIKPDEKDEGITEFYSIGGVIARGNLLIGLLKVLRDDLPHEPGAEPQGIGYTVLAWSRDGETWQRDRQPFLERNPQPGTWDRAMTWGDYQLIVGDETYLYYGGYARGHKVERFTERQIGLARMKRDRYVSRDAGAEEGWLRTPPALLEGDRLTVNADVRGELRVAVLDAAGKPLKDFGAQDGAPIRGDSLAHTVRWKQPLAALRGKPVQLELRLRDARLYGFALEGQT